MKKIIILCLMFFAINVYAECDSNELSRLKKIAEKIEFTYQHTLENKNIYFDITASNLHEDIRALIINDYYTDDYREFEYSSNGMYKLSKFDNDEKVVVTFKAFVPNECSGQTVYVKTLDLPFYNVYQARSECDTHPDFKYCQEFLDNYISETTFENEFKKYIDNNENTGNDVEPKEKETDFRIIIYAVIIIFCIILGIYGICLIIKNKKANEL